MVDSEGDGLKEGPPRLAFDHVIVRAEIDGKTYWMDPTRSGDERLERLTIPHYVWGLPIRAGGAELEPLVPVDLTAPSRDTLIEVDATGGLEADAPLRIHVTYSGDDAVEKLNDLNSASRTEAERSIREAWESETWIIETTSFGQNRADGTVFIEATGVRRGAWETGRISREQYTVALSSIEPEFAKRSAETLQPDAPYALRYPTFDRYVTRVRLPANGKGFEIAGPDVDIKAAGQWVVRRSRIEDGVAIIEEDDRIIGPEVSAAEVKAGETRLEESGILNDLLIRAPRNFKMKAGSKAKAASATSVRKG